MQNIDYASLFIFFIVFIISFVILLNIELDESINDKWTKLVISLIISICLSGGMYIYNIAISDELMTSNFAFDDVILPEPQHLSIN